MARGTVDGRNVLMPSRISKNITFFLSLNLEYTSRCFSKYLAAGLGWWIWISQPQHMLQHCKIASFHFTRWENVSIESTRALFFSPSDGFSILRYLGLALLHLRSMSGNMKRRAFSKDQIATCAIHVQIMWALMTLLTLLETRKLKVLFGFRPYHAFDLPRPLGSLEQDISKSAMALVPFVVTEAANTSEKPNSKITFWNRHEKADIGGPLELKQSPSKKELLGDTLQKNLFEVSKIRDYLKLQSRRALNGVGSAPSWEM